MFVKLQFLYFFIATVVHSVQMKKKIIILTENEVKWFVRVSVIKINCVAYYKVLLNIHQEQMQAALCSRRQQPMLIHTLNNKYFAMK